MTKKTETNLLNFVGGSIFLGHALTTAGLIVALVVAFKEQKKS